MVELEWDTERRGGATFVAATVTNTRTTPQTVRLESRLDGPIRPPRRDGTTDPAWTDGGWLGTIDPGRQRGVGFASPAAATDPPLAIVETARADDTGEPSTNRALADLEAWSPTIDACTRQR